MAESAGAQNGGAAIELTLVAPVLIILLLFVVELGRVAVARGEVDGAARDAARAASTRRSPGAARAAAEQAAQDTLAARDVTCRGTPGVRVAMGPGGFTPGGSVSAEVTCAVDLYELSLLKIPATRTMTGRSVSAIDTYRGIAGGGR